MKLLAKNYNRIVIKVGSSILFSDGINLDVKILYNLVKDITQLAKSGKEVVIVSSGAIAFGMHYLGLKDRPKELYNLQAASAIGQNELMSRYRGLFEAHKIRSAQVLLTWEDFADRKRYLNAKNTILALLKYHAVPIVNENDTVATDEIKFGDNDRISCLVSKLISADILVILSDVDGLLDRNKTIIREVNEITPEIKELACPTNKKTCVGGMITKIEAAKISVDSGIPCVLANGRRKNIISTILKEPRQYGTLFLPKKGLTARKHWIAFGSKPKGKIIVDDGAKAALMNKKSLLSVGVVGCEGAFEHDDIVSIQDKLGNEFARGRANVSSKILDKIKGSRTDKEVIHCDNIVIIN